MLKENAGRGSNFARQFYFCRPRWQPPASLVHAEIFYVHVATQSGIEEQVPAGVMIVVVDVDAVAVPFPIAAAIEVVIGNYPIGVVVEDHAASPIIDAAGDKHFSYVLVAAVWIGAPRLDAVVFGIPIGVRVVRIVPALVFAVVVPVAFVTNLVLFLSFVLPVVVAVFPIATVLSRR
jgi:hypothetical protein